MEETCKQSSNKIRAPNQAADETAEAAGAATRQEWRAGKADPFACSTDNDAAVTEDARARAVSACARAADAAAVEMFALFGGAAESVTRTAATPNAEYEEAVDAANRAGALRDGVRDETAASSYNAF